MHDRTQSVEKDPLAARSAPAGAEGRHVRKRVGLFSFVGRIYRADHNAPAVLLALVALSARCGRERLFLSRRQIAQAAGFTDPRYRAVSRALRALRDTKAIKVRRKARIMADGPRGTYLLISFCKSTKSVLSGFVASLCKSTYSGKSGSDSSLCKSTYFGPSSSVRRKAATSGRALGAPSVAAEPDQATERLYSMEELTCKPT